MHRRACARARTRAPAPFTAHAHVSAHGLVALFVHGDTHASDCHRLHPAHNGVRARAQRVRTRARARWAQPQHLDPTSVESRRRVRRAPEP
eukprot:3026064-Pleurochrysis_carterae.AAC.1